MGLSVARAGGLAATLSMASAIIGENGRDCQGPIGPITRLETGSP